MNARGVFAVVAAALVSGSAFARRQDEPLDKDERAAVPEQRGGGQRQAMQRASSDAHSQ